MEGGEGGQSACSPVSHILTGDTTVMNYSGRPAGGCEDNSGGGDGIGICRAGGERCGKRSLSDGVGEGVFLVRTTGTWGEPVFAGGHFFSVHVAGLVGECPEWPVSGDTDGWNWSVIYSGKRGMVWAGVSASRTIGDQATTDPGGGDDRSRRGQQAWQLPVGRGLGPSLASSMHPFPPLGSHPTEVRGRDNRHLLVRAKSVLASRTRSPVVPDSPIGLDWGSSSVVPPVSGARKHGRGIWPAGWDRRSLQGGKDGHMVVRENIGAAPLSVEAVEFSVRTVPKI